MVEKFMPEFDQEGRYVVRQWGFLGDQGFTIKKFSAHHIVKSRDGETRPERHCTFSRHTEPVPAEARALREKMGIDFGRFDYVEIEGGNYVFDANKTPAMDGATRAAMRPELLAMAEAIEKFV